MVISPHIVAQQQQQHGSIANIKSAKTAAAWQQMAAAWQQHVAAWHTVANSSSIKRRRAAAWQHQ